jgi:hypothetical protein
MAKRRKEKDEEEEKSFKMPKFDEENFLKRERRNIKATLISTFFGAVMALICFGFWVLMGSGNDLRWPLVFLVGIVNAAFIRYIFLRINLDLTEFTGRNWFGSYAIYFFSWLVIFILIVNPPFYDEEPPRVEVAVLPGVQEPGGDVLIVAKITDNVGIDKNNIQFDLTYPDGSSDSPDFQFRNDVFRFNYANLNNLMGEHNFLLLVTDSNGLKTEYKYSFTYANDTLTIISTIIPNMRSGDSITIKADERISKDNFKVYYRVDNGTEINVNRRYKEYKDEYETSPKYIGWKEQTNVTVKLYAEVIHYFQNIFDDDGNVEKFSNIVENNDEYIFSTGSDSSIGFTAGPLEYNCTYALRGEGQPSGTINYSLPCPSYVATPGFEALIFIISLMVVVLIFRYRKKNRRNQK